MIIFFSGLLNLRGKDKETSPIFYSFLIVTQKDVILFVTKSRITSKILTHFEEEGIDVSLKSFDKKLLLSEIESIVSTDKPNRACEFVYDFLILFRLKEQHRNF